MSGPKKIVDFVNCISALNKLHLNQVQCIGFINPIWLLSWVEQSKGGGEPSLLVRQSKGGLNPYVYKGPSI